MSRSLDHITQTISPILVDGHFQIFGKYFIFESFNSFTGVRIGISNF